jgi:hypothetical protein
VSFHSYEVSLPLSTTQLYVFFSIWTHTSVNMSREKGDDTISNEEDEIMLWEEYFVEGE